MMDVDVLPGVNNENICTVNYDEMNLSINYPSEPLDVAVVSSKNWEFILLEKSTRFVVNIGICDILRSKIVDKKKKKFEFQQFFN